MADSPRDTSFFDLIKQRVDLVDYLTKHLSVDLVGDGAGRMAACCPFHAEDTPSFKVSDSLDGTSWKRWHCFGACQEGGTVIDAVMKAEQFEDAFEAARYLNDLYDLGLDANDAAWKRFKKTVEETTAEIAKAQREMSDEDSRAAKRAREYLYNRGFTDETIEHFGIAVDKDAGRLTIPLIDKANHAVSIANRALFDSAPCKTCKREVTSKQVRKRMWEVRKAADKGEPAPFDWRDCPYEDCGAKGNEAGIAWLARQDPKYLFANEFEKAHFLYHQLSTRKALLGRDTRDECRGVYVVEGYADVWSGWQSGHRAIVAYNGGVMSPWQAKQITEMAKAADKPVILVPDTDKTGQANVEGNYHLLREADSNVIIQVVYGVEKLAYTKDGVEKHCKDIGEVLQHFGAEKLYELLVENRWPVEEYLIRFIVTKKNERTGQPFHEKRRQMQLVREVLANVNDQIDLHDIIPFLAEQWRLPFEESRGWFYSNLSAADVASAQHLIKDPWQALHEALLAKVDGNVIPIGFEDIDKHLPGRGVRKGWLSMCLGKAQPLDAKILTPAGWKRMGDMQTGDEVVNPDGGISRIVGVFPQGDRDIYRVTFSDGSSTECDLEHLWKVSGPGYKHGWKVRTLAEIQASGALAEHWSYRRQYIPMVAPVELREDRDLPLHPYLLGVLLGDGCLTRATPRLTTADPEIIELIKPLLPAGIEVRRASIDRIEYTLAGRGQFDATRNGGNGRFNTERNALTSKLDKLDLVGRRSEQKSVPDAYLNASKENRLELLRGLMDTDGSVAAIRRTNTRVDGTSIETRSQSCEFCSASVDLARAVAYLARSFGGASSIVQGAAGYRTVDGTRKECLPRYRVRVSLPPGINPFKLQRKASVWAPKRAPRRYIAKIEPVGVKKAQCIALDSENQLYITDDFIVTHNSGTGKTMLATQLLANMAANDTRAIIFSLEQPARSLWERMACQVLDMEMDDVNKLMEELWERMGEKLSEDNPPDIHRLLDEGCPELAKVNELHKNLYIVDNVPTRTEEAVSMTPGKIEGIIREINTTKFEERPADVVIIDHLGILEVPEYAPRDIRGSDTMAPGWIMQELFKVCKATNVFMLVAQQLPKEVPAGQPVEFDQGKGGAKQTEFCDVIFTVWRPELQRDIDDTERQALNGEYRFRLAKNRHGATTTAYLYFDKRSLRIIPAASVSMPVIGLPNDTQPEKTGAANAAKPVGSPAAEQALVISADEDTAPLPRDSEALLELLGAQEEGAADEPVIQLISPEDAAAFEA